MGGGAAVGDATARDTGHVQRGTGRAEYTAFIVDVQRGGQSWRVYRRYNQFVELHESLKKHCAGGVPDDSAIPQKVSNQLDTGIIAHREALFDKLMVALHSHPTTLGAEDLKVFLAPIQLGDVKPK